MNIIFCNIVSCTQNYGDKYRIEIYKNIVKFFLYYMINIIMMTIKLFCCLIHLLLSLYV